MLFLPECCSFIGRNQQEVSSIQPCHEATPTKAMTTMRWQRFDLHAQTLQCSVRRQYQRGSPSRAQQWPDSKTLQGAQGFGCLWAAFRRLAQTHNIYTTPMSS